MTPRAILSAIEWAGASSPAGATTPSARPAGHRGYAWRRANYSNGIARSTSCTPVRRRLSTRCFSRFRDLFSLRVDMVFYDLTSTYFEGEGPPTLGAHGHSRDGKPRNRQVLAGLVVVDGWPIAHHVFAGHRRDARTVPEVLRVSSRASGSTASCSSATAAW
jgi:hypothetical protein